MTDVQFGRLQDLPLRDAWKHEAHSFTPWLAQNIDHIAEAIGIPLELTGQEVRVESFAADILARNPQDDSLVLIENQLEATDHTHLGQIMTYLAGLEAQTVVWIAPSFREPHLSAIRWLNEHTADGFSFFAVRLRVVRIADSPFAPIFEIVEKPNDWDRRLTKKARSSEGQSELTQFRVAFWDAYTSAHPEDVDLGIGPAGTSSTWMGLDGDQIIVVLWIGQARVGIFVRGPRGSSSVLVLMVLRRCSCTTQRDASSEPLPLSLAMPMSCHRKNDFWRRLMNVPSRKSMTQNAICFTSPRPEPEIFYGFQGVSRSQSFLRTSRATNRSCRGQEWDEQRNAKVYYDARSNAGLGGQRP